MGKRHKHADLIHEWCEGAEIEVLIDNGVGSQWVKNNNPIWCDIEKGRIRIHDPYRELKEAQASGKVIQWEAAANYWVDCKPDWIYQPERYRVKPEPKTVKKYIVTVVDGFVDKAEWVEVNEDEC